MAVDFERFNQLFGGNEAVNAIKEATENNYSELPDGKYVCKLENLELGESAMHKPMIKGMFRIIEGVHKKQCIFYNQVFCRSENGSAFSMHKGLEFLRSLQIFDDTEVDFDGDYARFNDLLLDMAEEAEDAGLSFEIEKTKDGDFTRLNVLDTFES